MSDEARTILLTGANGGLGRAIAARIVSTSHLACNYGLYTVRGLDHQGQLETILDSETQQHQHEILALDLSQLSAVRKFASKINERVRSGSLAPIKAIILNAAYQEYSSQSFTVDGFDMTFQCTYLSHWLLVLLLLQSMDKDHCRIVVVGSWSHDPFDSRNDSVGAYKEIQWKTLFSSADGLARGTWSPDNGYRRYGAAKLCCIMNMYELQQRLDADSRLSNITVVGVDPGAMVSGLTRRASPLLSFQIQYILPLFTGLTTWLWPNGMFRTVSKSADDVLHAAFNTTQIGPRPKPVYMNGSEIGDTSGESKDGEKRRELWSQSLKYTELQPEETILSCL